MFSIRKIKIADNIFINSVPIFPIVDENDYLHDYAESDIGQCISTLGVVAMLGDGIFRMGDSTIVFSVVVTGEKGAEGIQILKKYAEDFIAIAEDALPEMSNDYKSFYKYMINDFKSNGVEMPHYGHI